jgi:ubiquinone/menaquinone biosynthesis C-methylase UbiE
MEMRQQNGRAAVLRQAKELAEKVQETLNGNGNLQLKEGFQVPPYLMHVDNHLMPGSYHTEYFKGDVSNAANYDSGLFVTSGGMLGSLTDGGGQAIAKWVRETYPDFKPKRILDIGCGLGHNALPIAQAFPEAQVVAIDAGAPMLRYGAARAKALGVHNVTFIQADAASMPEFADASFDWVQTTMFLHELSYASMRAIFRESFRVLKPGGIVLHVEQPQYAPEMPLFEQAMRDWDAFYNNEPFWSTLHEIDLDAYMVEAGFSKDRLIHDGVTAVVDRDVFPDAADDEGEDYGRKAAWHVIGARK